MAIIGLALVGSACAVGYRNMFAGSVSPTPPPSVKAISEAKTIPSVSEKQAASHVDAREAGPATTGSIDNMVPREDQPAGVGPSKAATRASLPRESAPATRAASQAVPKQAVPHAAVPAPASRLTIEAAPSPLANRAAQTTHLHRTGAPGCRTCRTSPTDTSGALRSRRGRWLCGSSDVGAQRKQGASGVSGVASEIPEPANGHQPIIRRADLGAAGIYYRALVGPFASAKKATKMCSGLKAAGGDCVIQKNP